MGLVWNRLRDIAVFGLEDPSKISKIIPGKSLWNLLIHPQNVNKYSPKFLNSCLLIKSRLFPVFPDRSVFFGTELSTDASTHSSLKTHTISTDSTESEGLHTDTTRCSTETGAETELSRKHHSLRLFYWISAEFMKNMNRFGSKCEICAIKCTEIRWKWN